MKQIIKTFAFASIALSATALAAGGGKGGSGWEGVSKQDKQQIEQLAQKAEKAWEAKSAEQFGQLFVADATVITPEGTKAEGKENIQSLYGETFQELPEQPQVNVEVLSARPLAQNQYLIEVKHSVEGMPEQMTNHVSTIAEKSPEGMRIQHVRAYRFVEEQQAVGGSGMEGMGGAGEAGTSAQQCPGLKQTQEIENYQPQAPQPQGIEGQQQDTMEQLPGTMDE